MSIFSKFPPKYLPTNSSQIKCAMAANPKASWGTLPPGMENMNISCAIDAIVFGCEDPKVKSASLATVMKSFGREYCLTLLRTMLPSRARDDQHSSSVHASLLSEAPSPYALQFVRGEWFVKERFMTSAGDESLKGAKDNF